MTSEKQYRQSVTRSGNFSLKPLAVCIRMAIAGGLILGPTAPLQAELPVPRAVWESMGSATREVMGSHMDIHQHSDRVILNWENFNIGEGHSVRFQQPDGSSIALNRIFQNDPSRILGSLTANGQVYLVNQNGFVFGKNSRVDVRGLVASTLDVSDEVLNQGITKVFASNGSAAFQGDGDFYLRNPDGSFRLDTDGNRIKAGIFVEEGAQIKATDGQNILIIAPVITNEGHIEADDRQVILAAATDRVFLQEAGSDGLLVEVQTGGEISNLGSIAARRGKVTLVGFAVNQEGKVSASTSLNINGTVRLLARENAQAFATPDGFVLRATSTTRSSDRGDGLGTSATVTFGENSRTEILPEPDGAVTAIDEQIQPLSQVEVAGHKIHFKRGAEIFVPGGIVDITATRNPVNPLQSSVNRNDSRVLLDAGAKIDVSGVDTTIKPMESNIVEVELRLNELKDSPLQREGVLFGRTILVDIRKGTPIADIQNVIDAVPRTLGERLAKGGIIHLNSEGDAIVQHDATLDFSGGAVTFLDGVVTTSRLTSNGRSFDISEAHPAVKYDGVYGEVVKVYEKWGIRKVWQVDGPFSLARRETGYVEGHDAGQLMIKSPNVLLAGEMHGGTRSGRLQRDLADRAYSGGLKVDMLSATSVRQPVIFSSAKEKIEIDLGLNDPFPMTDSGLSTALVLQAEGLERSGIQDIAISANDSIVIGENSHIRLADGGHLSLQGSTIDIDGTIKGAGADVSLTTVLNFQSVNRPGAGLIQLGDKARIDLQGGWVNDRIAPFHLIDTTGIAVSGGSFRANASGDIDLKAGSIIDVSGGAWLDSSGRITEGNAGSMHLIAARPNTGSGITLDGTLQAYGLQTGGMLELEANAVVIGQKQETDRVRNSTVEPLVIDPGFFGQHGFAEYLITANINGLTVDQDARITLQQVNRILDNAAIGQAGADSIGAISRIGMLPDIQRKPGSLTLTSYHTTGPNLNSHLTVEKNAVIAADPLSSVTLVSDSSLIFDGSITAHGGQVSLSIIPPAGLIDPLYQPAHGIWLGENARIDVSGIALTEVDALGRREGEVFDGGRITLEAARGFIAAGENSLLDVSGTAAQLNLPRIGPGGLNLSFDPVMVGSNGGSIEVTAADGIFPGGQMRAFAGGDDAAGTAGGKLLINIDGKRREPPVIEGIVLNFPTDPGVINISQQRIPVFSNQFGKAGDTLPAGLQRRGYVSADQVREGGFSNLALRADDEIRFQGEVELTLQHALNLDAPRFSLENSSLSNASDSGQITLNAAQVSIGSSLNRTAAGDPEGGAGSLAVNADLIELYGGSYTTGFHRIDFNADSDIRLNGLRLRVTDRDFIGEFKTFSSLDLTADRIYPNTLTDFTLAVTGDPTGTLTFNPGGDTISPVLSAYAKLSIIAPNIHQHGIIRAPFGEIILEAANRIAFGQNSITSVSPDNQIIPFGVTEGGLEWLYPIGNQNLIVDAPNKNVTLRAAEIRREEGALIDLSGGGDLVAFEFIPGVGGSADVLATDKSYAVIPKLSGYAPFDPLEFPRSGLQAGDRIYLEASDALPAGHYTLLPARYALLPGAYLITPQAGTRDRVPGTKTVTPEGATVVAGFRSIDGTTIRDQRWSGFAVEPGEAALTRSQLNLIYANQFFVGQAADNAAAAPGLPRDAGHLTIEARTRLDLPGVQAQAAAGGLPGLIDIAADKIAVVNDAAGVTDAVEISVDDLDALEIGSLLLGGTRKFDSDTGMTELNVSAHSITLAENTALHSPEIILAATDHITLQPGSSVVAKGAETAQTHTPLLQVTGDGALLRATAGTSGDFLRTGSQGQTGALSVSEGAVVSAETGSILLDSTRSLIMEGELRTGKTLEIGAETINLGEVSDALNGLSLDNAQLSRLNPNALILTSRGNVNIYGSVYQVDADGQQVPAGFNDLTIDGAGFAGFDNTGRRAALTAKSVTLRNSRGIDGQTGDGAGEFLLEADTLILGGGDFKVSGFGQATFNLGNLLSAAGETKLTALSDVTIRTGYLTGATGSSTTLNTSGYRLAIDHHTISERTTPLNFAANLKLLADSIDINAPLLFQGGTVTADATSGNVTLGNEAVIDVSGIVVPRGLSQPLHLSGGQIDLTSKSHDIVAQTGSRMLLNGHTAGMAAGALHLNTVQGHVRLQGIVDARGGDEAAGGSVRIDTSSPGEAGFSGLNSLFDDSGFTDLIDLRIRNGDLTVAEADSVTARSIKLAVDKGTLTLAGELDARGEQGGTIDLASDGRLLLTPSARLRADAQTGGSERGDGGDGGRITLSSVTGAGIDIQQGALIDVSANGGKSGEVHLRADRQGNDIRISPIAAGTIIGDPEVLVEAVRIYTHDNLDDNVIDTIRNDTHEFMSAMNTRLGSGYEIKPGIEIRADGDMMLSSQWDFADWRYGSTNTPGHLTLRAGGDVILQQGVSDAFAPGILSLSELTGNPENDIAVDDMLQPGRSWSYNIVAGADVDAADNFATLAKGDILLGDQVKVRTGTGDIGFYAGRDIVYGSDQSVVYTAGRPDDINRFGFSPFYVASRFYAEYPVEGGDITFHAGGDIRGAAGNQLVSDWLVRTGNWSRENNSSGRWPTAWGVLLGDVAGSGMTVDYRQNLGALGGGNIVVMAKGDIHDLSVVIPTTGKQVGQLAQPENLRNFNYLANEIEINGGGDLYLEAGGSLYGGMYYVDGGSASLNAGDSLRAGTPAVSGVPAMNPVLAMGDSRFTITAVNDVAIGAVVDPMILPQPGDKKPGNMNSLFFRYSADSAVSLTSLAGDISLDNDVLSMISLLNDGRSSINSISFAGDAREALLVNPATLQAHALQGDVRFLNSLIMFPSASGQFEIHAGSAITTGNTGNNINIVMSDTDPGLLPGVAFPAVSYNEANLRLVSSGVSAEPDKLFKAVPNHINDLQPALISTGSGDIISNDPLLFVMAKPAQVMAGNDIRNVSFQIQHNSAESGSIINAGRDFRFDIERSPSTGALINKVQKLEVSGPGRLTVLAGHAIDLGASQGVTTVGNQINPALAEDGAHIHMIAGLIQGGMDVAGFAGKYLADNGQFGSAYLQAMTGYVRMLTGDTSLPAEAAADIFAGLDPVKQTHFNAGFLAPVRNRFNELVKNQGEKFSTARNSFDNASDDNARFVFKQEMDLAQLEVLAATEALFPGTTVLVGNTDFRVDPVNGIVFREGSDAGSIIEAVFSNERNTTAKSDIAMFFSRVHSTDGGDINLYAPAGGVNAGLAVSSSGVRDASQLGIVAVKQGSIHSVVRDDFQVNTTRVMTLSGGDIVIGSTDGNIDAGRGAKTALASPPPIVRFDERGNFIVELPPAVAGSGIRANVAPDGTQGDVLLFALQGIIDASEAGVGGKDVMIGATAIVGSDNIDIGGVSVGVPVASTGSIAAGLGNVANVAAAVTQALDSTIDTAKNTSDKMAGNAALGVLSVDIIGFGDEEIE